MESRRRAGKVTTEEEEEEDKFLSSPEQDVSGVIFHTYTATSKAGGTKLWAIGVDSRGVHTWFTEPDGARLIYYHKPLATDFHNSYEKAERYVEKKIREKEKKQYSSNGENYFDASTRTFHAK